MLKRKKILKLKLKRRSILKKVKILENKLKDKHEVLVRIKTFEQNFAEKEVIVIICTMKQH